MGNAWTVVCFYWLFNFPNLTWNFWIGKHSCYKVTAKCEIYSERKIMAKSDFVCGICNQVKTAGLFLGYGKYKCPNHKFICGDHVTGLITKKCNDCDNKVLKYAFNRIKGKWERT